MQSLWGNKCGSSSVGRARPCQGRGREFESRLPLIGAVASPLRFLITRPGGEIGRHAGLKILLAAMSVRVQVPPRAHFQGTLGFKKASSNFFVPNSKLPTVKNFLESTLLFLIETKGTLYAPYKLLNRDSFFLSGPIGVQIKDRVGLLPSFRPSTACVCL